MPDELINAVAFAVVPEPVIFGGDHQDFASVIELDRLDLNGIGLYLAALHHAQQIAAHAVGTGMLERIQLGQHVRVGIGPDETDRLVAVLHVDPELGLNRAVSVTGSRNVDVRLDFSGGRMRRQVDVFLFSTQLNDHGRTEEQNDV